MSQAKHITEGWVELEAKTDGWYYGSTKVCGLLGEDLHKNFYRAEIKSC